MLAGKLTLLLTVDVSTSINVVSGLDLYFLYNVYTWIVMIVTAPMNSMLQNIVRNQFLEAFILPNPWADV